MRVSSLLVCLSLIGVGMPIRAQTPATATLGSGAPRRGLLTGFGPFARATADADVADSSAAVEFTVGLAELTVRSRLLLDGLAATLANEPKMRVLILRPAGPGGVQDALGMQRADVTVAYLVARGVARFRINIAGRGIVGTPDDMRITIVADPARTTP